MSDRERIVETVTHCMEGIRDGSGDLIAQAFYSSVNLNSFDKDDNLVLTPRNALEELAGSGTLPENSVENAHVEINHDMTPAKVMIDPPTLTYHDLLTLLRLKSGRKIVSKT